MINAATILREHVQLMADVDRAIAAHQRRGLKSDEILMRQGKRIHGRFVRLLHMVDEVDETELQPDLADQLASVRRHLESSLWASMGTAALERELAGLDKAERDRRFEAGQAEIVRQVELIWGKP